MLKKKSKTWLIQHINDPYVKKAIQKGYRSRAAFKLLEILDMKKIILSKGIALDLGSSPGSWSQVIKERFLNNKKLNSKIIALDILPMENIDGVDFIQGDFRDEITEVELYKKIGHNKVNYIFSDMAPNLSGIPIADSSKIQDICDLVFEFSKKYIDKDGVVILKTFHCSGFSQIKRLFKLTFKEVIEYKPLASKPLSSEVFIIARNIK